MKCVYKANAVFDWKRNKNQKKWEVKNNEKFSVGYKLSQNIPWPWAVLCVIKNVHNEPAM